MVKRDIDRLKQEIFDLVVIGGGVSGGAIAWDAALRGHKVALLEKKDFGHATSAATSKLIHGGLRYLSRMDFRVVRESLRERRLLEQNAPHQAFPISFLLPVYEDTPTPRWMLGLGLTLYDILAYDKNELSDPDKHLGNHRWLSPEQALQLEPGLDSRGLRGAFHYYDVLNRHPERSNLDYILSAYKNGAVVANYAEVNHLLLEEHGKSKKVHGVAATDLLNDQQFDVRGKITINATGPWGDQMLQQLRREKSPSLVRSKGIHLLLPKSHKHTTIAFETRDKHHFFLIPWQNRTLVGTTDAPYEGDLDKVRVTRQEAREFLDMVQSYYPMECEIEDVQHHYAGIRPLTLSSGTNTYSASRKHEIVNHRKQDNASGFLSVFGGKWTTSRALAEQVVDQAQKTAGLDRYPSRTKTTPLEAGRTRARISDFLMQVKSMFGGKVADKSITRMVEIYGADANDVLALAAHNAELARTIEDEFGHIQAEIFHAVEREMAFTLEDFLMRRCGLGNLGFCDETALKSIASHMGSLLGWDKTRQANEIALYKERLTLS